MNQEKSIPQKSGQRSKGDSHKPAQQDQGAGRSPQQHGEAQKGERPIADVDRKVRGGDA